MRMSSLNSLVVVTEKDFLLSWHQTYKYAEINNKFPLLKCLKPYP
jgi:hypothetical protein